MDFSENFSKIEKDWIKKATKLNKTIVLPEANLDERVKTAAEIILKTILPMMTF